MSITKEYREYLKDNPKGYWFKARLYGWGWVPARWQGFAVLFIFFCLVVANALRLDNISHSTSDTVRPFLIQTFILVIILLGICWKTGERPHWKWGLDKSDGHLSKTSTLSKTIKIIFIFGFSLVIIALITSIIQTILHG